MEVKDIKHSNRTIHSLLDASRVKDAFEAIEKLVKETNSWTLREQLEQLQVSYRFMLQYLQQGLDDPQRGEVYNSIIGKLYTIADSAALELTHTTSNEIIATRRRELKDTSLSDLVAAQHAELNKYNLLSSVPTEQQDRQAITNVIKQREIHDTAIFNKVWSSFRLGADDASLIEALMTDDAYPDYAKCLITAALFVGLMCYYDERKLQLLISGYTTCSSPQVQLRSLISLLLAIKVHYTQAKRSTSLAAYARAMIEAPQFASDMAIIQFQLARTRNTENLTRRVKEELMPEILKMRPDIMRKMSEGISDDLADLEANPEWQEMLENSGMARRMEELTELQLEGSDVYISTFSRLKTFPFFHTLSNWFLPFHELSSHIYGEFDGDQAPLMMLVSRAPFLCNSDRYSFALSLSAMPASQRNILLDQVKSQVEQMGEMQHAELPDPQKERERQANMYVQDLYRFFKLFSRRREFIAAFDTDMDFTSLPLIGAAAAGKNAMSLVAEFYFKNAFYDDAIKYYSYLLDGNNDVNPIIYQKMGFCYQSNGKCDKALEYYKRYELADDTNQWTLKHIAACYRAMDKHDKAFEYYSKIDIAAPQNVANIINMGHCMLEQGHTSEALNYYFKADVLDEAGHRARRPIAWCSFLLGNDARSLDYYDRIIAEDKPTAGDYINRGHLLLAMKNIPEAIVSYRNALKLIESTRKQNDASQPGIQFLRESMLADKEALRSRGINLDDIPLLLDAIASPGTAQEF